MTHPLIETLGRALEIATEFSEVEDADTLDREVRALATRYPFLTREPEYLALLRATGGFHASRRDVSFGVYGFGEPGYGVVASLYEAEPLVDGFYCFANVIHAPLRSSITFAFAVDDARAIYAAEDDPEGPFRKYVVDIDALFERIATLGASRLDGSRSSAPVTIRPLDRIERGWFAGLLRDAERGGFTFVERLVREWESGDNRFARRGERLFGVFSGEVLVGCGGINVDPYASDPRLGRIRHVYVLSAHRRARAGQALLETILAHATEHFDRVRLKTETMDAVRFYESLGFEARTIEDGFELTRAVSHEA